MNPKLVLVDTKTGKRAESKTNEAKEKKQESCREQVLARHLADKAKANRKK